MKIATFAMAVLLAGTVGAMAAGQLTLSGASYVQNFDSLSSGMPTGWSVNTGATVSAIGITLEGTALATLVIPEGTTKTNTWGSSTAAFKNLASATNFLAGTGLTNGTAASVQEAATDRALGIRQTATFGDPGASFMLTLANTTNLSNFTLSFDFEMLSVQGRSTTWTVDYRKGGSGSFTSLGTIGDSGTFGVTNYLYSFGNVLDDYNGLVEIRMVTFTAAPGSGSRDTMAIDEFKLTYDVIPEPSTLLLALMGLATCAVGLRRRW